MTNILVIDDNGDLRAAICLALERAGFAVTGCERRLKSAAGGARKVLHLPGKGDLI